MARPRAGVRALTYARGAAMLWQQRALSAPLCAIAGVIVAGRYGAARGAAGNQ